MPDVISTGEAFSSTDAQREIWTVTTEVVVGTALYNVDRSGVAYTNSGGVTRSSTVGGVTSSGIPAGGVGLDLLEVSVATDGSYEYAVTGAVLATANGVLVYAVMAGVRVDSLTLTVGTNKRFGVVNNPQDYVPSAAGIACVKIGV